MLSVRPIGIVGVIIGLFFVIGRKKELQVRIVLFLVGDKELKKPHMG